MKLPIKSANGECQAYAYTGGKPFDASLPCIVFLHGALCDHSVFTLLARWFAHHGHSVLALDLPGHGLSEGPPPASIEDSAEWLWAVLDAAGVKTAALVGHSMGSLIALHAAARAPERCTRLVMIGTAYPMKVSEALLNTAKEKPLQAIDMVNTFSISTMAGKPSFPGPGMWLHGANQVLMRRVQDKAQRTLGINLFAHDFGLCDRYTGGAQACTQVRCPVTFILGASDQMTTPKASRELATLLKAKVHTLPAGHHLMAEAPDGVLNALRAALC
jgi:pimeloyl-ACP methyl ester carboxylesterase